MSGMRFWTKRSDMPHEIVDGEWLILDPETNALFRLNRVGGRIWDMCDDVPAQAIAAAISREFEVDQDSALRDVEEYVQQMMRDGLILQGGDLHPSQDSSPKQENGA
jgi:hypothetical protein